MTTQPPGPEPYAVPSKPPEPRLGPRLGPRPDGPPGAHAAPRGTEPSKALAVTALVLSLLVFVPLLAAFVSVGLAVVVLLRCRDGRDHGRSLAIIALVVDALVLAATVAVFTLVLDGGSSTSVNDLDAGDCITASGLADAGETVDEIEKVGCGTSHDGEVLATARISAADARDYDPARAGELCVEALDRSPAELGQLVARNLDVTGLTGSTSPAAGDSVACIAFDRDGAKLTAPVDPAV